MVVSVAPQVTSIPVSNELLKSSKGDDRPNSCHDHNRHVCDYSKYMLRFMPPFRVVIRIYVEREKELEGERGGVDLEEER